MKAFWFYSWGWLSKHTGFLLMGICPTTQIIPTLGAEKLRAEHYQKPSKKTASSQGAKQKSLHPYAILTVLTSSFFGNILGSWNHGKKKNNWPHRRAPLPRDSKAQNSKPPNGLWWLLAEHKCWAGPKRGCLGWSFWVFFSRDLPAIYLDIYINVDM